MKEFTLECHSDGLFGLIGASLFLLILLVGFLGIIWLFWVFLGCFGLCVLFGGYCVSYTFSENEVRKNLQNYSTISEEDWEQYPKFEKFFTQMYLYRFRFSWLVPPTEHFDPQRKQSLFRPGWIKVLKTTPIVEIKEVIFVKRLLFGLIILEKEGCMPRNERYFWYWCLKNRKAIHLLIVNKKPGMKQHDEIKKFILQRQSGNGSPFE